jgi:hypothetical protein
MLNLGQITATVQKNCHISDAQFAADYTLCVFLLKMREFYRWENQIPFTGNLPREDVGRWMQERERMWETLETNPFEPLPLGGRSVDPFDSEAINRALVPLGYVYSAGYGRFGKPHFFLGNLQDARERDGVTVYISTCEYARDLVAPPAMLLGNTVYLRQESLRRVLWERIEEWHFNRRNDAMSRAVADYGFDADIEAALDRMTESETESAILHELGEAQAEHLLGADWAQMLAAVARSKSEILARAVRDLLADCLATLPGLIERDRPAALHFFFANFSGMRRHLYPEALTAYEAWRNGDRQALARLADAGRERWLDTAHRLLALYRQHGAQAGPHIEALLDHPAVCPMPVVH